MNEQETSRSICSGTFLSVTSTIAFMQEQKSSSRRIKFCRMMRFIFFIQPDVVLFDPIKILVVKRRRKNQKENGFLFQSIISTITHKLLKEPFAEEAKRKFYYSVCLEVWCLFVAFIFSFRSNQNPFAEKAKEKQNQRNLFLKMLPSKLKGKTRTKTAAVRIFDSLD